MVKGHPSVAIKMTDIENLYERCAGDAADLRCICAAMR